MLENFNITSLVLKRHVKISVYLPKHYNENSNPYNSIFLLDGQNIFYDNYADNGVSMKLANTIDEYNADVIVFAIHSPKNPDWRLSEFIPFDTNNSNLDNTLANKFVDFFEETLIPLLEFRYRLNDNKAIIGFNEGAISASYIASYIDKFKIIGLFSPIIDSCKEDSINLFTKIINNKIIHLFFGGLDNKISKDCYEIFKVLDNTNNKNIILDFEENETNDISTWNKHIITFINKM